MNQVQTTTAAKPVAQTSRMDVLKGMLDAPSVKKQFENALAKNAPTFIASIIDLLNGDSKLQMCDPKQVIMEALKAAVLHLPINKALGYAYIIPFNNSKKDDHGNWRKVMEPTFQLGYKGYIQLAMRTGQYRTLNADVVYEGEIRKVNKLSGEIAFDGTKLSDNVIGYFCYFELLNGFSKTLYMTVEQMAHHAKHYSKGVKAETTEEQLLNLSKLPVLMGESKTVGWMGNFHAMAVKTVIRNLLSKYGYLSVEMQTAIENDYDGEVTEQRDQNIKEFSNAKVIDVESVQVVNVSGSPEAIVEPSAAEPEDINPGY